MNTPHSTVPKTARSVGWLLVAIQAVLLAAVFLTPSSHRWTAGPNLRRPIDLAVGDFVRRLRQLGVSVDDVIDQVNLSFTAAASDGNLLGVDRQAR